MFIESLIKRKNGSSVTLGDNTYRFNAENNHICEVNDDSHIDRLLSITNGFKAVEQKQDGDNGSNTETGAGTNEPQERAELVERYIAKFGKAPHPRAGIAKIKAELEAE